MEPVLELKNISYAYHTLDGETKTLTDISFSVASGEFVAIVGPSGCGKSTLLSIISGLLEPEKGLIKMNGKYTGENSMNIGYMLQHDYLFEWRTVYKNVLLGLEIQHMLSAKSRTKAMDLLETYGLKQFANSKPSELSGGMRQRAALIRTLVLDPDILLLDEPFSSLDYQNRLFAADDIGQIIRSTQKTALLVTHDLSEAVSLADRVIILTNRPASISKIVPITFDLEKDTPLHRRNAPEFKNYFNTIWEELNQNE
ncbi:ABC transporter ATP-binding protein [Muricomes intestini]|jgi:NitT/TauT family transport system ATP-binding protein|uniref:NitT/TauT family transport system ATP-binding protein n=1 Tax=Muricomes intestini TaxID=1796634 RepID=A0A4R3K9T3_9FIRM|nr:ABC transporter ATP-binding protein [Muricomes intestini]TCS79760.1 NitT/TauT family transport system ATP-binding protein [Muricomes intestini]HAX52530.1 spermidine/putrescine ABC transporter ATP-binding protein [Lachnospiraceae bacterium]HCR82932.1 spermidine/putrescine ABC transporter ATP-binding protein [Lachnospiraceae bacterium]